MEKGICINRRYKQGTHMYSNKILRTKVLFFILFCLYLYPLRICFRDTDLCFIFYIMLISWDFSLYKPVSGIWMTFF